MPLIHPFTHSPIHPPIHPFTHSPIHPFTHSPIHTFTHSHIHTFTHQRWLAAMQGTNQLVGSNQGSGVLLRDTSTRPGWDWTGNPLTARWQLYLLSHIAPDFSGNWPHGNLDVKELLFLVSNCQAMFSLSLGYWGGETSSRRGGLDSGVYRLPFTVFTVRWPWSCSFTAEGQANPSPHEYKTRQSPSLMSKLPQIKKKTSV